MFYFAQIRTIRDLGNQVRVENTFGGYATFNKIKKVKDQVYMVIGPVNMHGMVSGYSTNIPVMAMGDVEKLNKEFGDFRKCSSAGASAAFASMIELRFIGANKTTLGQINDSFSAAMKSSENVFIRLDGDVLELIENKMQGRVPDRISSNPPRENILVANLQYFKNNLK